MREQLCPSIEEAATAANHLLGRLREREAMADKVEPVASYITSLQPKRAVAMEVHDGGQVARRSMSIANEMKKEVSMRIADTLFSPCAWASFAVGLPLYAR